jgi:prolyl-tRNA editing enzyme YbaK/EbsC (Cys-tRNA(Pro) deacylase)
MCSGSPAQTADAVTTLPDPPWEPVPALQHPDLLAPPVLAALSSWAEHEPRVAAEAMAVPIDPSLADTAALNEAYRRDPRDGVNCVVVVGKRAGEERIAAVCVRADTRADVNNAVKRMLDVRKATFLGMERAVSESAMEYGGITPVGVPVGWRVLVDSAAAIGAGPVVIGSGLRRSKLLLPADLLATLPGAEVVSVALPAPES